MDKTAKIGSIEAISLIIIGIINRLILNYIQSLVADASSSSWIVLTLVSVLSLAFCYLLYKCFKKFSSSDILDVSEFLGGKFLKVVTGILYIALFIIVCFESLKSLATELKIIYFTESPIAFLILFFLVGIIVANHLGFKTIARTILIIVPAVLISILVVLFSVSGNFQLERIFPILGNGIDKILLSTLTNLNTFTTLTFLFFLNPFLDDAKTLRKVSMIGIGLAAVYCFITLFSLILILPTKIISEQTFTMYTLTRIIEYGRFFQRTEALFILLWIISSIAYTSACMFFITYIFKKITNTKNSRPLIYPFAAIIFSLAVVPVSAPILGLFEQYISRPFFIGLIFVFSFGILFLANIKKGKIA